MRIYVNMLKDAQRKLQITNLLLSDSTLLATATKYVFTSQEYPDDPRDWEREPKDAKTWSAWKIRYNRAYKLRQLAHQTSDRAIHFVSTDAAMGTRPFAPQQSAP